VGPSKLFLNGNYAYAGEYDLTINTIRPISVPSNSWCSAGAYLPKGTIMNNGGGDGVRGFTMFSTFFSFGVQTFYPLFSPEPLRGSEGSKGRTFT
jgi:hypothetical protein